MTAALSDIQTERFEKHLGVTDAPINAIDLLAEHTNFSRQRIKQIMHQGAVWLTQGKSTRRVRRGKKMLQIGDTLHLYYDSQILSLTDFNAILIKDETDYSVWYKPSGMLSQGTKYGDHCAIHRWAETHLKPQRNAFPVHRLDKATSGLILIAHSKKAAQELSQLFSQRKINKYYKALVSGKPSVPQTIDEPLDGKSAITRLLDLQMDINECYSLLDIQILTGRKHQIRQHLTSIGHPVIGDRLYGGLKYEPGAYKHGSYKQSSYKQSSDEKQAPLKYMTDLCLTAYKMTFTSPFDQQHKYYELGKEYFPPFPEDQEIL